MAVRMPEPQLAVRLPLDLVALLVDGAVVSTTQEREVGQRRGATVGPVPDVVPLSEPGVAARESTATIAMLQRPTQGGRDRARARPDLQQVALGVVAHDNPAGIAGQAL